MSNLHVLYNQVHTLATLYIVIGWFQLLLKHGASKTIRDQDGLTPLDVSLQHGDDNDVAKLLQQESN